MDEPRIAAFAEGLLGELLADGMQVIVLTHGEALARAVEAAHEGRARRG